MERITRGQLLRTGIAAVVTMTILSVGIVHAQADKPVASPWAMTIDLALDPATGAPAAGPFYAGGMLLRAGRTTPVGTFHSWGWRFDPTLAIGGSVATSSFEIAGQGEIVVSGVEDGRATITGGTGNFRGVGGQADMVAIGPNTFRVTFDITSYRNGPN